MKASPTLRGYRRTIAAAGIGLAATTTTLVATAGTSASSASTPRQEALDAGRGLAVAQTYKVDPKAGSLSIGATLGISIAGHQNNVAQASSQAINLGVIGTTLAGEGCDGGDPTLPAERQPQALAVDSRDEGAAAGMSESEAGAFSKEARAEDTPFGEAITTTAPFGIPGALQVGSGRSITTSGLVERDGERVREARAITEISSIEIAGTVKLSGLRWEAVYQSAGGELTEGSFSIGQAELGPLGRPIPTNNPTETIAQVNNALRNLGVEIAPPSERETGGVLFVDPLNIAIVPNELRDGLTGPVLEGIQPIRENLFDRLLAMDCGNATYITVFDIVLGSITGVGSFNLGLGGVQASSGLVPANDFDLGFGDGLAPTLPNVDTGGADLPDIDTGDTDLPDVDASTDPVDTSDDDDGGDTIVQQAASIIPEGKRGGALLGIGLGSLALAALAAEGDRRKMRRAQREIPAFD